ncbi:MAG: GntR family transcriptional regulator [Propionibacteriaceae bacterium]|nr:GntR family transcriptional regulator [Propionibacteriaceae bacterium]
MIIDIDPASAVPAFEQVRAQMAQMIRSGVLPEGHRLPPIRHLAADLALAPGTVARVYKELEAEGLVRSRVRHGTVVTAPRQPRAEARSTLEDEARLFAASAARLGFRLEDALDAVRGGWQG